MSDHSTHKELEEHAQKLDNIGGGSLLKDIPGEVLSQNKVVMGSRGHLKNISSLSASGNERLAVSIQADMKHKRNKSYLDAPKNASANASLPESRAYTNFTAELGQIIMQWS